MFFHRKKESEIKKKKKKNNNTVSEIIPLIHDLPEEHLTEAEEHLDSIISDRQKLRVPSNHNPKKEKEAQKKT